MLIDTLRKAHFNALNEINRLEIAIEELSNARKAHHENPNTNTLWNLEWWESRKQLAISNYTDIMESIIEPVMLGKEASHA